MAKTRAGQIPWNKGVFGRQKHTSETKARMSESHKRMIGEKAPFFGRHHSSETKSLLSKRLRGIPKSSETRAKMSASGLLHVKNCDGSCGRGNCRSRSPSDLAWRAYDLLLKDFAVVIPEARFGPYSVDFLLAEEWLAVEVDGSYWHKNRDYASRDEYLLREHGLPTVRVTEQDVQNCVGSMAYD